MNARDFAVVVAINRYRQRQDFADLGGPVNDATDFLEWVKSPTGGAVPDKNVDPYVLLSTKGDGTPAGPTRSEIEYMLGGLYEHKRAEDQPIGRRLYAFFAGHGFTPSLDLALLHATESRRQTPTCVSGTQWLDCFHLRALFDELVLCMDCCRDFEAAYERPAQPCLRGSDRALKSVKRLYMMATGFGQKAYEDVIDGKKRGLFSAALLAALRGDAVDGDGKMTAANVAESVRRALGPHAAAGLNWFPEPVVSPDFVLFDDRSARTTKVRIRVTVPTATLSLFRGDDQRHERPIAPTSADGPTFVFDLPRGKTYLAFLRDAGGGLLNKEPLTVVNDPISIDLGRA